MNALRIAVLLLALPVVMGAGGEKVVVAQAAERSLESLFSSARILPVYVDGQVSGYQVSRLKAGSFLDRVGLRDGNRITGVNGNAVGALRSAEELFAILSTAEAFSLQTDAGELRVRCEESPASP